VGDAALDRRGIAEMVGERFTQVIEIILRRLQRKVSSVKLGRLLHMGIQSNFTNNPRDSANKRRALVFNEEVLRTAIL
jgi:hypothetical protein